MVRFIVFFVSSLIYLFIHLYRTFIQYLSKKTTRRHSQLQHGYKRTVFRWEKHKRDEAVCVI